MHQLDVNDPRLVESTEALADMAIRGGFRCRFNAPSPLPARMHDGLPCAWGAIKALGAFAEIPAESRSPAVQSAVECGLELLRSGDLANGGYPTATGPSPLWRKFGFPLGYTSDLLEALEVLGQLRAGHVPGIEAAVAIVRNKRDGSGRWTLEYTPENMWAEFGQLGAPNKWVALRALRTLNHWEAV
jgi:hypothetical protein